jgi:hypothetical protein
VSLHHSARILCDSCALLFFCEFCSSKGKKGLLTFLAVWSNQSAARRDSRRTDEGRQTNRAVKDIALWMSLELKKQHDNGAQWEDSHYLPIAHSNGIKTLLFPIVVGKKPSTIKYVAFLTREICVE